MKKIKLKKKKNNKTIFFIICFFIIIMSSLIILNKLGKKINTSLIKISESESKKITKIIVNKSVSDYVLKDINTQDVFIVDKKPDGLIQSIDLDSNKVNMILNKVNEIVYSNLKELEIGESNILNSCNDLILNSKIISNKKGVIFNIPIGIVTDNSLIANLGPKIPVKIIINGDLETQIKTSVENYGINNALLKIFLNIKVSEQIILPLYSSNIVIENDILLAAKMIQGEIPNYYFNDLNNNYTI